MKAIVKVEPKPGLSWQEVPEPQMKENEVLIKIQKTAICGTDLHIYNWNAWAEKTVPTPLIIGHEFMGKVAQVGSKVSRFKVGDRVTGEGHLSCGTCSSCRDNMRHLCLNVRGVGYHVPGAFAEYFTLREENVVLIPDTISDEVASILDPLGNAVHTVCTFDVKGKDILITGGGPIGLMACAISRYLGARQIVLTDKNDFRLHLAKKMGASCTYQVPNESILGTFSIGFEMSGSFAGLQDQLAHMQPAGKIALLGILPPGGTIDWHQVIFKMLTLKGIYGREIFGTWNRMLEMLQHGLPIDPVITHRLPAKDFQQGLDLLLKGQAAKVLLEW